MLPFAGLYSSMPNNPFPATAHQPPQELVAAPDVAAKILVPIV
jgi:hypothetical protein